MRPLWSGTLSFGLINIPVKIYSASFSKALGFKLLEKERLCPIGYLRVCKWDNKEVKFEDIVRGYEYEKGDYVILQDADFKKANVAKTESIEILKFADEKEIDAKYIEKPYYLEPDRRSRKAYVLLREALRRTDRVGIARYVLKEREHLGLVKVEGNIINLIQMRYDAEIRPPDELAIPRKEEYSQREIDMAVTLIDNLTEPFNIREYKEAYSKELKKIINQKIAGKEVVQKGEAPQATEVADIFEALKKSLERQKHKQRQRQKQKP